MQKLKSNTHHLGIVIDLDCTILSTTYDTRAKSLSKVKSDRESDRESKFESKPSYESNDLYDLDSTMTTKFRPHLSTFLNSIRPLFFQIIVYTHATREYAQEICRLIDPLGTLIDTIYSKTDEPIPASSPLENDDINTKGTKMKDLRRLFHTVKSEDLENIIIIDERTDVWIQKHQVIKIFPYPFWHSNEDYLYVHDHPWPIRGSLNTTIWKSHLKSKYEELLLQSKKSKSKSKSKDIIPKGFQDDDNVLLSLIPILTSMCNMKKMKSLLDRKDQKQLITVSSNKEEKKLLETLKTMEISNNIYPHDHRTLTFLWNAYKRSILKNCIILFMDPNHYIYDERKQCQEFGATTYVWEEIIQILSPHHSSSDISSILKTITHIIFTRTIDDTLEPMISPLLSSSILISSGLDLLNHSLPLPSVECRYLNVRWLYKIFAHFTTNFILNDFDMGLDFLEWKQHQFYYCNNPVSKLEEKIQMIKNEITKYKKSIQKFTFQDIMNVSYFPFPNIRHCNHNGIPMDAMIKQYENDIDEMIQVNQRAITSYLSQSYKYILETYPFYPSPFHVDRIKDIDHDIDFGFNIGPTTNEFQSSSFANKDKKDLSSLLISSDDNINPNNNDDDTIISQIKHTRKRKLRNPQSHLNE